ncbi:hypothetical protein [Gordonia otitidis]|uniref:HhH-GPD domain-containing protein n=1 Tax=Gordonia otitidis (strain DSM 44809 / CCUG 52243 / JCM 12355 / NBRC 100426 / IFM 10032) TaxID=1108044 RepID=H5TLN4_GORO1|nr:hypothetical protein [Gordonia otitidis]GAB34392.1 hypothetical protein GOOTI_106_00050 [Gordonia otitidis NBRC 100426]
MVRLPEAVMAYTSADVEGQTVPWKPDAWRRSFVGCERAFDELSKHVETYGGIKRGYIRERAGGDPTELFLLSMAWGYGTVGYGPTRVSRVLSQPDAADKLAAIVNATRDGGAEQGWKALLRTDRIKGFGMAFGTKLLYFAGYATNDRPRPLILDAFVRRGLHELVDPEMPSKGLVRLEDYLRYLHIAEEAAIELGSPEVLEYALFDLGKKL